MDEQAYWGIVLGGLGALIGVIGGAVGTYFSIKNTSGPKERDYMLKSAVFFWAYLIIVFGILYFVFSDFLKYSVIFLLLVFFLIPHLNKKQREIALSEQKKTGESSIS